jgi:hypothetical protein
MDLNIVDPLMKPLSQPKHGAHMRSMSIRYLHQQSYCMWETCVTIMFMHYIK